MSRFRIGLIKGLRPRLSAASLSRFRIKSKSCLIPLESNIRGFF
jgi:hypothetical protein